MAFYVETSSVRKLGSGLGTCVNGECYTSALVLLELLGGDLLSSEKGYGRRAAAIRGILSAGIRVLWDLPQNRIAASFGLTLPSPRDLVKDVKALSEMVASTRDRDELVQRLSQANLKYALGKIVRYDSGLSADSIRASVEGLRKVRDAYKQQMVGVSDRIPRGELTDWLSSDALGATARDGMVWAMAAVATRVCLGKGSGDLVPRVLKQYDGSLDVYIDAATNSILDRLETQATPGINDAMDTCHFMFLGQGDGLVTEDNDQRILAARIGIPAYGSEGWRMATSVVACASAGQDAEAVDGPPPSMLS